MINTGKSTAIDLFKIFDQDSSSNLTKNELQVGLKKLGVNLSNNEVDKLMYKITNKKGDESCSFGEFKIFFEKNIAWKKTNENQNRTNTNNSAYGPSGFENNQKRYSQTPRMDDNNNNNNNNNNFGNSEFPLNNLNETKNDNNEFPMNNPQIQSINQNSNNVYGSQTNNEFNNNNYESNFGQSN